MAKPKKQTIPTERNYLAAILDGPDEKTPEPPKRQSRAEVPAAPKAPDPAPQPFEPTRKFGFRLPDSLCEEIRDAVVALQGPPLHLTVSEYGEEACRRELERLKAEYNDGKPFPKRGKSPRTGRPIGG